MAVESLTDRLEREAYDYFERIDRLGGVVAALNENFFQREIAEASYRYQQEVEDGRRLIVGVNAHTSDDDDQVEILRISPDVERRQRDRLNAVRGRRDGAAVEASLQRLSRGRRERPKRDAGARRVRPRLRLGGRDLRRPAGRVGRLPGDARLLTGELSPRWGLSPVFRAWGLAGPAASGARPRFSPPSPRSA